MWKASDNDYSGYFPSMPNNTGFDFGQAPGLPYGAEWNFCLPTLQDPRQLPPEMTTSPEHFTEIVAAAIQNGYPEHEIESGIASSGWSNQHLLDKINGTVMGFPVIFYAVARNDLSIIRLIVRYGGNVNSSCGNPPVPLLAFAIIHSKTIEWDTTEMLAALLSLGADASVLPNAFYTPFYEALPGAGPDETDLGDMSDLKLQWCKPPDVRSKLAEVLNITQRYHLHQASRLPKPTERQKQVARRNGSENLFGVPYFMIGQRAAVQMLQKHLLHYMLMPRKDPLVLVFAGPSGHGKTELARRLGAILSLDLHVSDCSIVSRENELFGARAEYCGGLSGAPLNNILARNSGKRCIVFLDEFEKTNQGVWNSLLLPFGNGQYEDRRSKKLIDCTNTIWILATNALDWFIVNHCDDNPEIFDDEDNPKKEEILKELVEEMEGHFINNFSAPVAGRVSAFIPFVPFSPAETYVGIHKYLLQLAADVRQPVNESLTAGNIKLIFKFDIALCKTLAKNYTSDLGVRCLKKAVKDRVGVPLSQVYLDTEEPMRDGGPMEEFEVIAVKDKISVKRVLSIL
ncbi:uncharacterized protein BP5553_06062 [Venustampulla echinocandica]|uniref:ATPase AAA-type core domain-containing protein n=1 Tax=Venustampulla echinocandica TaxID=2656787 RepID=A0A370TMF9_9HELO|nr:uncharacterized protein BP5553_06062 [Venustampulla echinocandica]RDL36710.1 hypothetical protein BP5553_06062 [Venustampulla echinocandica]